MPLTQILIINMTFSIILIEHDLDLLGSSVSHTDHDLEHYLE